MIPTQGPKPGEVRTNTEILTIGMETFFKSNGFAWVLASVMTLDVLRRAVRAARP